MNSDLLERREKTFDLLIVKGFSYSKVVRKIADEYDVTESGVKSDISRMENWLPKLVEDDATRKDGLVRLRELRGNRQRLQQMALEAQRDNDRIDELRIREQIEQSVELDIALTQSLGETEREPDRHELEVEGEFSTGAMDVVFEKPDDETLEGTDVDVDPDAESDDAESDDD